MTMDYRKQNNIRRNDFFDNIWLKKDKEASVNELTAFVGNFYVDGFGTNSSALSFMLYEVARNIPVQQKLRAEIFDIKEKYKGEINFDALQEMTYLDAVVSGN